MPPAPAKTTPAPVAKAPTKTPAQTSTPPAAAPAPAVSKLSISPDIKVGTTSLSGHTLVNIDVVIAGSPTLVTSRLKNQSITLIPGKVQGEFVGSFTFDPTEDLAQQTVTVEARDKSGTKITQEFPVNITNPAVASSEEVPLTAIPVANEASIIKILRIVFGVFATVYMGFLAIDAILIHRAKIKRAGIHPHPHILVLFLIAAVALFSNWI